MLNPHHVTHAPHHPQEWLQDWLNNGALISTSSSFSSDELQLAWGEGNAASFYSPDFFLESPSPWVSFGTTRSIKKAELFKILEKYVSQFQRPEALPRFRPLTPKDAFQKEVGRLQNSFKEGALRKAVPVIFEGTEFPEKKLNPVRLAKWVLSGLKWAEGYPLSLYGSWKSGDGILGATPETLLARLPNGNFETMALAGTSRDGTQLLKSPKDLREHQWVIDGIASCLAPLGAKAYPEKTRVVNLPGLSHLQTLMKFEAPPNILWEELIKALHPTPALGAFPKDHGWEWLKDYENRQSIKRRRFGAPFGISSFCVVAIRCLQWYGGALEIGAGCGIVDQSISEQEWAELQLKLAHVKRVFGIDEEPIL